MISAIPACGHCHLRPMETSQEIVSSACPEALLNGRPLRVLMLTDYFPKPTLPMMGVWALEQARSLVAAGAQVLVVSPTSWIPPLLGRFRSAQAFAQCPAEHVWDGGVGVKYPRWFFYSVGPIERLWHGRPGMACRLGWWTIRGRLGREIERWRPDVVFVHHTVPCGTLAVRLKKKYGLPYVVQDHDFGSIESCEQHPGRRRAFERVAAGAWAMAGVSNRMCNALAKIAPGVRTVSLYNGTRRLGQQVRQTPRPSELEGKVVVFSAAIFYARKGIPVMIEAFASVADKFPNAVLRIGGEGHERPAIEAAMAKANLGDRIKLLGSLDHQRVLQEMVWSDVFMLVGWEEPCGVVYLEAMSAGKPVICCSDCGLCDVLEDGVQGRTVSPKDVRAAAAALEELLADKELRLRMGRAAGELFERRLTSEATARVRMELLRDAAKASNPPGRLAGGN
jgi:glycosyltransferase involved in cell wall biosynthesis